MYSVFHVPTKIYLTCFCFLRIGYHEEGNSFGVMKKGTYKPASDFGFEFVAEVICENPHSSGFMVALTPDRDEHSDAPPCTRYTLLNQLLYILFDMDSCSS